MLLTSRIEIKKLPEPTGNTTKTKATEENR